MDMGDNKVNEFREKYVDRKEIRVKWGTFIWKLKCYIRECQGGSSREFSRGRLLSFHRLWGFKFAHVTTTPPYFVHNIERHIKEFLFKYFAANYP